ncbi:serine acetyltransferase [Escherichia coli]|uniref:serine acetyltransferase n=1 Tax=Escherichia coli TaxID=562 RepID=UPI0002678CB1|nr:serine acetyltransferase [Escherichia coli]EIQ69242.1 bacterial transferase hexapeptide family protein [Escherichia coli EPEC C342-62]EFF0478827.1 serine acetyltransferase [Escherichia coli]EII8792148.1 serine acetyltransferase [Escherichia coli]EJA1462999.1 serine acetyltransferase [Escherichia coli]CTS85770.1 predicted serine acetlyltransferase [Escherichia coli]
MLIKNPISYFHIGTFLFSERKGHLLEYWKAEIIMRDNFTVHRLIRNGMQRQRGFLLWWRLANEMYISGNKKQRKCAIKIKNALMAKYGCDIGLGARIGKGFVLPRHSGVVIHGNVKIGENVIIRQNATIGEKESDSRENYIVIGDNVDVGAHTCIIGLNVKIGSNVKIGAMSFIMEDVPDNCTYVTRKESRVIMRQL